MSDPNATYNQALSHPLVAKALFIAEPAWVWSTSGESILWSNEAGCRFFDTKSLPDLLSRTFRRVSPATVQIARMAGNTEIGVSNKSTLRFFRGMNPITISATLERILLIDGTDAIFVRAAPSKGGDKPRRASKSDMRLMKLFSRGNAATALLSSKGKLKEVSDAFHEAKLDHKFLRKAVRSLKEDRYISLNVPDENRVLHLCALHEKDGAVEKVFATLTHGQIESVTQTPSTFDADVETHADTQSEQKDEVVFIDDIDINTETPQDDNIITMDGNSHNEEQDGDFTFTSKDAPTRFLFTLNAHQEVTSLSPEIAETLGEETGNILGQNWADVSKRFNIDPTGTIARKIKRESIWTETMYWPISGTASLDEETSPLRAPVTMTAMPIFNSAREFEGFRGFGSIETANVAVHDDLDIKPEDELEEPEHIDEEWEKLLATTPLPDNGTPPVDDSTIDDLEPAHEDAFSEDQDISINFVENDHDSTEDELRWSEDSEIEEALPFLDSSKDNENNDDNKVVPLHRGPVGVPPAQTQDDETSTLSKPERHAFKQIADALSARLADKDTDKGNNSATSNNNEEKTAEDNDYSDIDLDAASIIEGHVKPSIGDTQPSSTIDERAAKMLDDAFLPKEPDVQSSTPKSRVAKGLGAGAAAILNAGASSDEDKSAIEEEALEETSLAPFDASGEAPSLPFERDMPDSDAPQTTYSDDVSINAEISALEKLAARDGILNRLPLGLIVSRHRDVLFANQSVLDFLGYDDVQAFENAGGINNLFQADTQADPGSFVGRDMLKHLVIKADQQEGHIPQAVRAKMADGTTAAVDLRLQSGEWQGQDALLMALSAKTDAPYIDASDGGRMSELLGQSTDIMDIASDGILIIDETGKLIHANSSAEALFDRDRSQMRGLDMAMLFAEESQKSIRDYLDGLTSNGVVSVLNDGREVIGQESNGGLLPLFITIGRLEKNDRFKDGVFCVVLRDITQWKRAEEELIESRRIAENANAQKSDFLASISHEIRTPLNAIIGFSEVMMEQHYGPMENPRYLEYARDINISGNHLMSLVNDLLDLSKIEAGRLELTFASVSLNPIIQECVALMQPDANRDRIIIRTSLMETIPPVVADARSIRQIALNLLSNAVKFTKAGGQVIISTTLEENGEVAIRVRDTGIGMSADDLEYAMQPFRQVQAHQSGRKPGTGLGLPLTKALVEANRASFSIDSRVDYGTLIQVIFPNERVLAR